MDDTTKTFSTDEILDKIKSEIESLTAESPDGKVAADDVRRLKNTLDSYMFPYIKESIKQSLESVNEFEDALNMLSDEKPIVKGSSLFELVQLYNKLCNDAVSFEIIMTEKSEKDSDNMQLVADILWHYLSLYSRLVTDVVVGGAYKAILSADNTEESADQILQTIDASFKEMCFTIAPSALYNLCRNRYNKLAEAHNENLNDKEKSITGCQLKLFDIEEELASEHAHEDKIVVTGSKTLQ